MTVVVPPVAVFPRALWFWAAFVAVFAREFRLLRRSRPAVASAQDGGTMRLIVVANQLAMLAAAILSLFPLGRMSRPTAAFWAGTLLLVVGGVLRQLCFRALGRWFTGSVTVVAGQPVIECGPYRLVRHPSYTAGFLVFTGIGLALGNWLGCAVLCATIGGVYARRVAVEERALLATLGEPYRRYMARTRRFVPYLF